MEFEIKKRLYQECRCCKSIATVKESFETKDSQKRRYEQHHNSLSDDGYRAFLENFIQPVLKEINHIHCEKIIDYGSGPEPALCELLRIYANEGTVLPALCEIRGWDPFFAPDTPFFETGADLATCLEVAEHFEKPLEDMKKLACAVHSGGYVAIGTMLIPEGCFSECDGVAPDAFKKWWYRSDSTHVAFYTLEGLIRCAENAGLEFIKAVTDRAFLFRKRD